MEKPQTALAFDYGIKQIGIAVGQTLTGTASPLEIIRAQNGQPDWTQVQKLINDWRPDILLIGLPLNMDGTESEFCLRTRKFARRLHGRTGLMAKMVDERLSTREAKTRGGYRESYREAPIDNVAAQIILESWLSNPAIAQDP